MRHPLLFLFGSGKISVEEGNAGRLTALLGRLGVSFREPRFSSGRFSVRCGLWGCRRLRPFCEELGAEVGEAEGLPGLLLKHRCRVGIPVGILAALLILFCSGRVVWSVRVEGCERLEEEVVLETLASCGLTVGTPLSEIYTPVLENRVLLASEDIAWISVNLRGTVARAVIREVTDAKEEDEAVCANLVASRAGVIAYFEDLRGNPAVSVGDRVAKGDLLVGGIYGGEEKPLRYTVAKGRVMARTEHSFSVRIPLSYDKKEYTGEEQVEKYLIFFKNEVKFFKNSGNGGGTCDTIDTVDSYGQSEDVLLPLGIRTRRTLYWRWVTVSRTREEAERLAREELSLLMEREVPDGALLEKRVWFEEEEDALLLFCEAVYLEDIAMPVTIEIEGALPPRSKE